MSDQDNRAIVAALWDLFEARAWDRARALLADDLVVDWPHTGERMRGPENFLAVNRYYPEGWSIRVLRIIASGDTVVSEVVVTLGDVRSFAASFFEIAGGRIHRVTEYWVDAEHQPVPSWRTPWVTRIE
ncbi:MAG: nuclear transport factor 2 family protein [Minicystis sp.]